jgi:hypothetical protein
MKKEILILLELLRQLRRPTQRSSWVISLTRHKDGPGSGLGLILGLMPHVNVHEDDQGTSAAGQPGVDGRTIRLSHDIGNAVNASCMAQARTTNVDSASHICAYAVAHSSCRRCTPAALAM